MVEAFGRAVRRFALYVLLVPDRWFRSRANRARLHVGTAAIVAALLYLAAAEDFFFEEFDARFNIVAHDYLAYPTEVLTDIRAARTSEIDYHDGYATRPPRDNLRALQRQFAVDGAPFTHLAEGRLDRRHAARRDGLGRLNVVVVASESFGAEFSRLHGSKLDLTPNFDAFARRGLWFANTCASGTRTVRGLEAITASFPPIPTVSILRRPGSRGIATWGSVMRGLGYRTSFLYGGYGRFDDMNAFFAGNGYEVLDRARIEHPRFANVWGASDEDLFDLALRHFDGQHATGQPFFSIVMTTSNHKPFTFRPGLEALGIPPAGGGRQAGVRYADHGARVYGKAGIPLRTYEIPLLVYAPKHLTPRRIDTLMTQIDIAPTVLGLGRKSATLRYERASGAFTAVADDDLLPLGIAYFQTAAEIFQSHRYR